MGVLMQAFYWNCPQIDNQVSTWWNFVASKVPDLQGVGITALWLPPATKAAEITSMGYDVYDYYDLGSLNQKGGTATWFGTAAQLTSLITAAHAAKMEVYADLVLHQNSGADAEEVNPIDGVSRWTKFTPLSGKFPRTYLDFQPAVYETMEGLDPINFGDMPNLCHRTPEVYTALLQYAVWLMDEVGYDGFRYDCVRGYGAWMVRAIQELMGLDENNPYQPFGVAECWDSQYTIQEWMNECNSWSDNPCAAFDFNLRAILKNLCDTYGFSLTALTQGGTILAANPALAVTFVENHDLDNPDSTTYDPIINDKMLAYSFILTHQGYPCVFWQDYYNYDLAQEGNNSGIAALVHVHEQYAGGDMDILHCDDNLYIMQRRGWQGQKGLVYVLNNLGSWNGASVQTQWANATFTPLAWRGHDNADVPEAKQTDGQGNGDFWAPPRGYAVYVPG